MTFAEYKSETINGLKIRLKGISNAEFNKYVNSDEVVEKIRSDYRIYSGDNIAKYTPTSTAHCLFMLY